MKNSIVIYNLCNFFIDPSPFSPSPRSEKNKIKVRLSNIHKSIVFHFFEKCLATYALRWKFWGGRINRASAKFEFFQVFLCFRETKYVFHLHTEITLLQKKIFKMFIRFADCLESHRKWSSYVLWLGSWTCSQYEDTAETKTNIKSKFKL